MSRSKYFRGWPKTVPVEDGYRIEAWHRTPWTVKIMDWIGSVGAVLIMFLFIIGGLASDEPISGLIVGPIMGAFVGFGGRLALRGAVRSKTVLTFTPGVIVCKRGWLPKKTIDATRIDSIGAEAHSKAEAEERKTQYKTTLGKIPEHEINLQRFFAESTEIVAYATGRREVLVSIFGKDAAQRLFTRINGLRELVNDPREWAAWEHDKERRRVSGNADTENNGTQEPEGQGGATPHSTDVERALDLFGLPRDFNCATLAHRFEYLRDNSDPGQGFILKNAHEVLKQHGGC
jgi:hypothetical protein